ncbi:MAG: NlpC/P60 family protein [Actinomycetota bacterium]
MQKLTHNARSRSTRLIIAVGLLVSTFVAIPAASATPSEDDLAAAQSKKDDLTQEFSLLVEQYNEAQVELTQIQDQLAQAQQDEAEATARADAAIEQLGVRVSGAYMSAGSELDVLLGSGDFTDFSDRLEFIDRMQQQDADLAAEAENASQEAEWAQQELETAQQRQEELKDQLADKKGEIESALDQQEALIGDLQRKVEAEKEAAREAAAAAAAEAEAAAAAPSGGGGTDTSGGGNPPINGSGATAAVNAAYSMIGTQYVWGGASPSGFDCSGLMLWSWQHGGVSLPHSSSAQYAATPRVDRGSIQPGDLLFFYSPISHVSMYVGGNSMIDASHPGPSGAVKVGPINWGSFVGAGRP